MQVFTTYLIAFMPNLFLKYCIQNETALFFQLYLHKLSELLYLLQYNKFTIKMPIQKTLHTLKQHEIK